MKKSSYKSFYTDGKKIHIQDDDKDLIENLLETGPLAMVLVSSSIVGAMGVVVWFLKIIL